MAHYIIVYVGGGRPADEEAGRRHMARYKTWLEDLGERAISPATPFGHTHTIDADGSASTGSRLGVSGYTLIEADSIDAALDIAKNCPFLDLGGSLEVSELMPTPSF